MKLSLKKQTLIILIFLLMFLISGCEMDESRSGHLSGGKHLSDGMMSDIVSEILGSVVFERESAETNTTEEKSEDNSDIVYWTETGTVWHMSEMCSHLSKSKSINTGSVSEAISAGKSKPCSRCGS